jgi:hypothetical protein
MTQRDAAGTSASPVRRICFLFNAQRHQLLHGVSIAHALARRDDIDVTIASPSADHLAYARLIWDRLGEAPVTMRPLQTTLGRLARAVTGKSVPPKLLTLLLFSRWLNRFDAIALPERTSIILKTMGTRRPAFIHLDHGAGDRAVGFDPRIRLFDFALMAGEKHRERLLRDGLIRDGHYAVVGYPKFDVVDAISDGGWTPFADRRPIILYNPHFAGLGSWEKWGETILAQFAQQDRYNLIVAPHVRLLDGKGAQRRWNPILAGYETNPHIHIDRGSDRSIDMRYTMLADVYLGDVSSQVYEYIRRPRPCVFLNAHHVDWAEDENYAHWHFGPVIDEPTDVVAAIDAAIATQADYHAAQVEGCHATFARGDGTASGRAADAIADFLARRADS